MRNLFSKVLGISMMATAMLTSCEDEFTEEQALERQQEILEALNTADNANALALAQLDAQNAIDIAELSAEQEMAFAMYQDSLERLGPVINYSVSVIAAGSVNTNARTSGKTFAPGATVTVAQGGVSRTETAGDGGVATFGDLRIGNAIVTVSAPDHTTVTFTTNLGFGGSDAENNVTTTIPLLPTTVAAGASEVSGTVYAQLDATTEEAEVVQGAIVRATLSVEDVLDDFGICLGCGAVGGIEGASYSNFTLVDTTDANGVYSLVIPNGLTDNGNGVRATIEFLPYEAEQTYYALQGDTIALVTKTVRFDPNEYGSGGTDISTSLPGVWAEVSSPVGNSATGLELGTKAYPTALSSSTLRITNGGSGYAEDDIFTFATGVGTDFNASTSYAYARVTDVDANGRITQLNFGGNIVDNGALYIANPGVPTPATAAQITDIGFGQEPAGTGATFELQFQVRYSLFIANGGSGYTFYPTVSATVQDYKDLGGGQVLTTVADDDINSCCSAITLDDFTNNVFNNFADIVNGVIVANASNGDTLRVVGPLASAPTFVVQPIEQRAAVILAEDITVDNGEITGLSFDDTGAGYASAPSVTFKSATDSGSGATVVVTIANGSVDDWTITNPGSGYMDAVNKRDTSPDNVVNPQYQENNTRLKPGQSTSGFNFNYQYGGTVPLL
ncbi:MAG: hypothetical protein ACLFUB_05960 [Cyclobacteriaceae bacterium]